jgi:peptidoglycan/xylan/chitin deacetylase (PgdA/CDA1 family)
MTSFRRLDGTAAQRGVPILMYHQVTRHPHPAFGKYTVTLTAFRRQMAWLARSRYETIGFDALFAARERGTPLPRRAVVLTFDDGFSECVEHAAPILREHGFTATFFLVAGLVGETSRWLVDEIGAEFPLAGWDDARALVSMGFACGAHSLTHPRLTSLDGEACRRELVEARRTLETELRCEVRYLAYPFGAHDARVRALARDAGYFAACSTDVGVSTGEDDRFALVRVPVTSGDTLPDFLWRLRNGESLRAALRRRLRPFRRTRAVK